MLGRRLSALSVALLTAMPVVAATSAPKARPNVIKPSGFAVSAPARSLPPAKPRPGDNRPAVLGRENEELPKSVNPIATGQRDGALQLGPTGGGTMPPTIANFEGNSSQDNFDAYAGRLFPPDTNGAAGLTQYVQTTNLLVRIWDKAGSPLTDPFKMSELFSSLAPSICSTNDDGDPVVVYDQLADRWLLSQFAFPGAGDIAPYHECVAVSVTGDATGSYYVYDFVTPGFEFPDYPKFGVWPDAYYMTTNQFYGGGPFDGAGAFAFDRSKMLAGDPNAGLVYFNLDLASHPEGIGGMLPSSVDGRVPPAAGQPNVFSYFIADEFGDASDGLRLFDFHVDFADPGSSTFTERPESPVAVAPFDPSSPPGRRDIRQPAPATDLAALDSITDRLLFRLAYRNFGDHESMVVTHSVNVGTGTTLDTFQAAPRYYELQRTGGAWSVAEQGTYAPDTDSRWMGSVAQDNQGNLAVGYSVSSVTTFPSIRYAGRLTTDPPNSLGQAETSLIDGTGVQRNENPGSRWGDYSAMTIDPVDDCTFWYTQEYYTAASQATSTAGWLTRVGSFKFPGCTAAPLGTLSGTITDCTGDAPLPGAVVSLGNGYSRVTDASGDYSMAVAPGNYTATVTLNGYLVGGGPVTVTDGEGTVADFCLTGFPLPAADGYEILAESCEPPNGVIDPGELVTVNLCVENQGGASTTDLVGTLLPGGGVISPSGSQNYGAVPKGASVCRDFTFMADPFLTCGGTITATLQLRDGLTDLGTAVFNAPTGNPADVGGEDFDSVTPPDLPSGWSTSGTGATLWVTTATGPDTPPNAAFAADDEVSIDKALDSPPFPVVSPAAQLSFRNHYNTEEAWDGGILEISIDGGAFTEITAAGGSFVAGGYNAYINPFAASPLAGELAWTGNSGGYITTTVNLPASAAGHDVTMRWRLVADDAVTAVGWWVDTLTATEAACCWAPAPVSMTADAPPPPPGVGGSAPSGGSNANGVIEPGETFTINPGWFNGGPSPVGLLGIFSNFDGPAGATYTINDGTADYGVIDPGATNDCQTATGDCAVLSIDNPNPRPATHWDTTIEEAPQLSVGTGAAVGTRTWVLHVGESFLDVPTSLNFYSFIETIFHKGITGGCGAGDTYCPANNVTRAQMAVFLLKAEHGSSYLPPPCTGIFGDVPCPSLFADWIEQLSAEGITAGCAGGANYCPSDPVLRQQMAVFLLKTLLGSGYVPPTCAGVFGDVTCPSTFANWIEDLAARQITGGCGSGNYCPTNPNTRGQMAVFLTKTFGLTLYGP